MLIVAGKFSLAELYKRAGFSKEIISRGKFAELNADNRSFTEEEEDYFAKSAMHAYKTFRDKAALSRKMPVRAETLPSLLSAADVTCPADCVLRLQDSEREDMLDGVLCPKLGLRRVQPALRTVRFA